jgi:preprotein translocase subunit SecY
MASAAEQLAANINFGSFSKATELKQRLIFTLGALIVYRFLTFVPLPGIDPIALQQLFQAQSGGVLGMLNVFAGGALSRMSIIALNIMPYITASIVVQLLSAFVPSMAALKKEGESGRKKLNQYTRYGTVVLTLIQGYGIAASLLASSGSPVVMQSAVLFTFITMISLLGGTLFLMWLGEQITSRGVGQGASLIIFAGIVAELPRALGSMFELGRTGELSVIVILAMVALVIGVVFGIVFMERAQRRVLVQYPKRQSATGAQQSNSSHLPLKLNTAGVIPPIFASSLLLMPATFAQFMGNADSQSPVMQALGTTAQLLAHGQPLYIMLYVIGIIFFCFFYTAVMFNPEETADNLKRYGGFIPGIRPGVHTAKYLDQVLTRITVVGSIYLAIVCVIPEILVAQAQIPFYLGGTSLLIVVNVTMDTVSQIQGHLMAHQYESVIKKAKLRGSNAPVRR